MLRGVIPALLTPFSDDQVDIAALRRLCDFLVSRHVAGIFITGTTGEFVSLHPNERRAVIREVLDHVAGKIVVLVHVGAYNTAEAVALTCLAREEGADGIGSMPPYFYGMDDEAQYCFFSAVLEAADGMPSYLYNIPQCAGNEISLSLIVRLKQDFAHLRGVKDSSGDMDRFRATVELDLPDFEAICGADHETLTALTLGGHASVTSTGNAFPEVFQAVYQAFEQGDLDEAARAQERLTALTKVLREGRYIAAYKTALRLRGVDVATVRAPQRELTEEEVMDLHTGLKDLGLVE